MSRTSISRPDIVAFMQRASSALKSNLDPPKDVFSFGEGVGDPHDELLELALSGKKTATTSYPAPSPPHWDVGDLSVILGASGEPRAIMRTLSFHQCLFKDVPVAFALAEGEGPYEEYRQGHFRYYHRRDGNTEFGDDSMVLCETFEVIYSEGVRKSDG
ncbi:PUA-like protein [Polychaeton citri CBS 116435]|uniref:PUA-like protein n=1 Tax=Polychaeton citri CBS 116435 TaxID=1314669 RepID=A0A9P4UQN0_9PEZI|nr:PUA-like protein [Polychaeton citri CBS 116435]